MWWMIASAAIGAATSIINTWRERERYEDEIKRNKKNAEDAYRYGKENSDRQYALQKGEALWKLGLHDRALREGMNQFSDEYNTNLLARAYGEQDARIQTASGIGASLAQEGMGGTRGNEANALMRKYYSDRLERELEIQKKQDAATLAGTVNSANRTVTELEHEKASWDPGGYRHESKTANDLYNKQMSDMAVENYKWQLNDMKDPWNQFFDYFSAFNSGASSGSNTGNSIYKYGQNWWGK
jgi:hypothetical protein